MTEHSIKTQKNTITLPPGFSLAFVAPFLIRRGFDYFSLTAYNNAESVRNDRVRRCFEDMIGKFIQEEIYPRGLNGRIRWMIVCDRNCGFNLSLGIPLWAGTLILLRLAKPK